MKSTGKNCRIHLDGLLKKIQRWPRDEIQLQFWTKYRTTEETGYDMQTECLVTD
jgi:hypothetical protein